ncbi:MAG TPA: phosphatase domain-containing protein [Thermoanaerobaculia bacterium]|nr:phosphatase domain-containing protein [Thermoanaerobaculia bacterium]
MAESGGWLLGLMLRLERALERRRPPRGIAGTAAFVQTYRAFGTRSVLHAKGRVLGDRGLRRAADGDSRWVHLRQTWKRIFTRKIAGAALFARYGEITVAGSTDDEGYFHLEVPVAGSVPDDGWVEVEVALAERPDVRASAQVLVPPPDAAFGIVSDIDDTVIRTDATSLFRMLRAVLFENAHVRLPFEGIAAFYRALHHGRNHGRNPIFYVSSGPWNLYDLLDHLFELRGIPPGPVFLQDWGFDRGKLIVAPHDEHKREHIDTVVRTYPSLPFLLIGDSGQRDPEIYAALARRDPGRILAAYVRDVAGRRRHDEVARLAEALRRDTGVDMILVGDTIAAAEHALSQGWIAPDDLPRIRGEKEEDEKGGASL